MNREYHKWYSRTLGRDMELLIFGQGGAPLLVFPTSMGRFFEFEDRGMIEANRWKYESGQLQAFCIDSVDKESWYNYGAHPGYRVWRHMQYERYVVEEVLPLIRQRNGNGLTVTGASFGGYHAMNFALRHPDLISRCVCMSGAFDIRSFVHGYYDENVYFNNPVDYVGNLTEGWYFEQYRRIQLILAVGEHDICLADNRRLSGILGSKGIPHWLDVWGDGTKHDWPWWQRMAGKYF